VVLLGGWVSYVVEEKIYVVKENYEYESIQWEHFGVFRINHDFVRLCFERVGESR
jgi:hypothetical protein